MRKGFGEANYPFAPKARDIHYWPSASDGPLACRPTISFFTHPVYTEKHVQWMIDAFNKVADHHRNKNGDGPIFCYRIFPVMIDNRKIGPSLRRLA
jgi:hypothetical protein